MTCLAILVVTAALGGTAPHLYDADTVSVPGPAPSIRLEALDGVHFDAPEIGRSASCPEEHELGIMARDRARSMMPGRVCIVSRGDGAWGRDVGRLIGSQGEDVARVLIDEGLAVASEVYQWCDVLR